MPDLQTEALHAYKADVEKRLAVVTSIIRKAAAGDLTPSLEIPEEKNGWSNLLSGLRMMMNALEQREKAAEKKEKAQTERVRAQKEQQAAVERLTKELKEELAKKTETIRESDRLRERFMVDASHELRTPLTVLQTNLDVLDSFGTKRTFRKHEAGELLESSKNQIRILTGILEELSLLSRGKKPEELRETIKLEMVIPEIMEDLRPLAEARRIKYIVNIQNQELEVMGDNAMMRKLIRNLVSNAIKYGKEQGILAITLRRKEGLGLLEVKDDGAGIPKKDLPFVFERFYRVDRGRTKEKGGVGLGLAICKWIAELHGGRLEVKSIYGKGSTFTIYLPLKGSIESRVGFWDYRARKTLSKEE